VTYFFPVIASCFALTASDFCYTTKSPKRSGLRSAPTVEFFPSFAEETIDATAMTVQALHA